MENTEPEKDYEAEMKTLEMREAECKRIEYAKTVTGYLDEIAGDIRNIPVFGEVAGVFTVPFNMIGHTVEFGLDLSTIALNCDDVPFDQIKLIMEEKFNEVNRKLDKQMEVLEEVSKLTKKTYHSVEKLRSQLKDGFKEVLNAIELKDLKDALFKINNFIEYFEMQKRAIGGLTKSEYVGKLEEKDGLLKYLKDSSTPKGDSLSTALKELLDPEHNYAVPKSEKDEKAFKALFALFYGTQAYVSVMFFLLEQHSYLAEYYYQEKQMKDFNDQFQNIINIFKSFNLFLVEGTDGYKGLIDKVIKIFEEDVLGKKIIQNKDSKLYHTIDNYVSILKKLKSDIKNTKLPLIENEPTPIMQVNFKDSSLKPPLVNWEEGVEVSYAVQYERNGTYSRLSKWTEAFKVLNQTNPFLKVPSNQKEGIHRLIFRKFNNKKPHLIGKLSANQKDFRDIDRDLYDAADGVYKNVSLAEFEILFNAKANIHAKFELDRTAMHAAAKRGNNRIALRFLLKNVKIDIKDKKGYTPLHVAAEAGQAGFVKMLVTHGANVNAKTTIDNLSPLHISARNGFSKTIKSLLNSTHIKVNQIENEGFTPLHSAVAGGYKAVEALLGHNRVNITARSKTGITPFHLAVIKENQMLVELFVNRQEDLNIGDNDGVTALHYAITNGNKQIVEYLLSLGNKVDVNAVTLKRKWSPLHFAIYFKREDISSLLIDNSNIKVNLISDEGASPLHLAVSRGQVEVVKKLLEKDAKIDVQTKEGYTPLHLAMIKGDINIFTILIEKNPNINTKSKDGKSVLHLAASRGAFSIVERLLNMGATLIDYDKNEYTAAHYAALNDDTEMMKLFIKHDPKIIAQDTKQSLGIFQIVLNFIIENMFKFLVKEDDESLEFSDVLTKTKNEGMYDMYYIIAGTSREDPTEEIETELTKFAASAFLIAKRCLGRTDRSLRAFLSASTNILNTKEWKQCVRSSYDYERRSLAANEEEYISSKLKRSPENYGRDFSNFYFKGPRKYSLLSSKPSENVHHFKQTEDITLRNMNTNGMLLLLDVLMRKITKEKYMAKRDDTVSESEAQANALNITEKFQELLNAVSSKPIDEQIDLAEVHANVYKAIRSGKESEISKTLCSYVETFAQLQPEKLQQLIDSYISKIHLVQQSSSKSLLQIPRLLQEACLSGHKKVQLHSNMRLLL